MSAQRFIPASSRVNRSPDEEGIKTGSNRPNWLRWCVNRSPDEEGIKTEDRQSKPFWLPCVNRSPDEEGIKTSPARAVRAGFSCVNRSPDEEGIKTDFFRQLCANAVREPQP